MRFRLPLAAALAAGLFTIATSSFARGDEKRPALLLAPPTEETLSAGSSAPSGFQPNYVNGSGIKGLRRWRQLPVRVYFDTSKGYSEENEQLTLDGFDQWTRATGGVLSYEVVDSERNADVIVRFSSASLLPSRRNTLGVTRFEFQRGKRYLSRARVELAVGGVRRPEELTEAAAHEWGHVLGIDGHSNDTRDLMYGATVRYIGGNAHSLPPVKRLTPRDINTIKTIYSDLFRVASRAETHLMGR